MKKETAMTNYTLTPALTDAVIDAYEALGGSYYGHGNVAGFWNYAVADGFTGTLDELVADVASDLWQNE